MSRVYEEFLYWDEQARESEYIDHILAEYELKVDELFMSIEELCNVSN